MSYGSTVLSCSELQLFLDWDGTMIEGSSLELIANIRVRSTEPDWESLTAAWVADYSKHEASYPIQRDTLEGEQAYLESLRGVEQASIQRLESAGIWQGVNGPISIADGRARGCIDSNEIERHAVEAVRSGRIRLRSGVADLCALALRKGTGCIFVVSVSWSAAWIVACLREFGIPAISHFSDLSTVQERVGKVVVTANEIDPTGTGRLSRLSRGENSGCCVLSDPRRSTGLALTFEEPGLGLWTAADKLAVVKGLRKLSTNGSHSVYVGDSLTDLLCLLDADIGICIVDREPTQEQKQLQSTLERLHFTASNIQGEGHLGPGHDGLLLAHSNFEGIAKYLYGI